MLNRWFVKLKGLLLIALCGLMAVNQADAASPVFKATQLSNTMRKAIERFHMWHQGCPVTLAHLRQLTLSHYDLTGHVKTGHLIVEQSIVPDTIAVFKALYKKKFPLTQLSTLVSYQGDWYQAQQHNVSYGFICRAAKTHGYHLSAYGKTVIINPVLNPKIIVVSKKQQKPWHCSVLKFTCQRQHANTLTHIAVEPAQGLFATNRHHQLLGMVEPVVSIFTQHGFNWSGHQTNQANWTYFRHS